jgi:RNA polymerase sigma factor (sigma-70 family)
VNDFTSLELKQLTDQQVRFAPAARRQEQLVRAQKLLAEVEPSREYPYAFVLYRITEHWSDAHPGLLLRGSELKLDLALFIKRVERSIPPLPIEQAVEPILTLEQISRRFNVSTKTIGRWRVRGLVGQRVIVNGRRQLGFPKSVVEQFLAAHQEHVERSARFSHLTEEEKQDILRRAKRLSQAGGSLTEVSRRIARRLGRSVEAIRYTIKNFDRDNPALALFGSVTGPLDGDAKELIYNHYRKGTPVETLAKRYGKTASSMYRVINEVKAEHVKKQPVDYIYHESFDDPKQEAAIAAPMPGEEEFQEKRRKMHAPKDVPADLASLYEWPLLSKEQEQHLFRQMNFLKHKLHKLQQSIDAAAARTSDLRKIDELQRKIKSVRDRLINCNMRLVVMHAKKHANQADNLFELVSDGNVSLMRAVEKFDYARGNKFSTYASWAIMKNFARSIPDEKRNRERYVTGHEDVFEAKPDVRTDESEIVAQADMAREYVNDLLGDLDPRTRDVIRMRNGLDGSEEMTLEQIGQHFGITKERVRQINVRGMKQLRERAQAEHVQLP